MAKKKGGIRQHNPVFASLNFLIHSEQHFTVCHFVLENVNERLAPFFQFESQKRDFFFNVRGKDKKEKTMSRTRCKNPLFYSHNACLEGRMIDWWNGNRKTVRKSEKKKKRDGWKLIYDSRSLFCFFPCAAHATVHPLTDGWSRSRFTTGNGASTWLSHRICRCGWPWSNTGWRIRHDPLIAAIHIIL